MPISYGGGLVEPLLVRPDGAQLERLEWRTDVLQAYDGSEQRVRLLGSPRRAFEFNVGVQGHERRTFENLLHEWGARDFAVPFWPDAQPLPATVTAGASVVPCDTATRDFRVGGLVALGVDQQSYEVATVDTIAADQITTTAPVAATWRAGEALVVPMRPFTLDPEFRLRRFTGDAAYGRLQLRCTEACDWPAASETTYQGLPVLTQAPNWTEDVDVGYLRKLAELDGGTGKIYRDDEAGGAITTQQHRWLLDGRAEIDAFRRWLYARQGRLSAFWLPTFAIDLAVVADIGSAATTIDVWHSGYTDWIAQDVGRRDVRIVTASGTAYHRRIVASTEISGTVERLQIDAALGAAVAAADVRAVHFMRAVRLEADAAEIVWHRWDVAECALNTRGSRNVV
jgi:hypothetical protein